MSQHLIDHALAVRRHADISFAQKGVARGACQCLRLSRGALICGEIDRNLVANPSQLQADAAANAAAAARHERDRS